MQQISRFEYQGTTFGLEPPVEAADGMPIKTVGDIAVAAAGYHDIAAKAWSKEVNASMRQILDIRQDHGLPATEDEIASLLQAVMRDHRVFVVR